MFTATNVIPFEIIQSQTLEITNPYSRREWKDVSVIQLLHLYEKRWLVVGRKGFRKHDWVEIIDKLDEAWCTIPKRTSKQCRDKVDKMQRTYNKYQQTQSETCIGTYKWIWFKKMHNIFARIAKAYGTPRAYNDGKQIAPKGASILNPIDIDEDVAQEIPKSL
jgi:hypothetical protein